jgi:hypothetical protein
MHEDVAAGMQRATQPHEKHKACASSVTVSAVPPTMSSTERFRAPAVLKLGYMYRDPREGHLPTPGRLSHVRTLVVGDEEMYARKVCVSLRPCYSIALTF